MNELTVDTEMHHPSGAVHHMCCNPKDPLIIVTATESNCDGRVFRLPPLGHLEGSESSNMKEIAVLDPPDTVSPLVDIVWRGASEYLDHQQAGDLLTMNKNGTLVRWDQDLACAISVSTISPSKRTAALLPRVAWDPHNPEAVAVSQDNRIRLLDWRTDTSTPTGMTDSFVCHHVGVTSLDYNPNKPYVLATSGQDSFVKFWDLRLTKRPSLTVQGGHSHWICDVQYNPFHDQLVLSSGTDGLANLWRFSSISSAPLLPTVEDNDSTGYANGKVSTHDQQEPSRCYWSQTDAWAYMIVSCTDGKVSLNHVPSGEKYKILL